jgi:hypothetical protein
MQPRCVKYFIGQNGDTNVSLAGTGVLKRVDLHCNGGFESMARLLIAGSGDVGSALGSELANSGQAVFGLRQIRLRHTFGIGC